MKRIIFVIPIMVILATSCVESKKDKKEIMPKSNIEVALPIVDSVLLHKTYPGSLSSIAKVDIVARVNGALQSILFNAGDKVNKGQTLFVIEPSTYKDAVAQAEAQLAIARSANIYAKSNYESMKEAAKSNAVSMVDLIQSESNLNQSIATIKNAEAALSTAKTNLSYCYITAPISGYITKSALDVGNYLRGAGSPQTLSTIYDNTTMNVNFAIEDGQYIKMVTRRKSGNGDLKYDKMPISFTEPFQHEYFAIMDYLSPAVEVSTGTLNVRAKIKNSYNELKSGMYVTVSLPYQELQKALLIKDASIGTDQLGKYVYVINDSNKVVYTPIKVGELFQDTLRIINSGLNPTDKYVTKALLKVRDGMEVNPVLKK